MIMAVMLDLFFLVVDIISLFLIRSRVPLSHQFTFFSSKSQTVRLSRGKLEKCKRGPWRKRSLIHREKHAAEAH